MEPAIDALCLRTIEYRLSFLTVELLPNEMAKQRGRWERVRMKCVIKAAVISGENPRFSPISATGYNLSVLRRRVSQSVRLRAAA